MAESAGLIAATASAPVAETLKADFLAEIQNAGQLSKNAASKADRGGVLRRH